MNAPPPDMPVSTTELLLMPDGRILVHNLTAAMAELLAGLNPDDTAMRERARAATSGPARPQTKAR